MSRRTQTSGAWRDEQLPVGALRLLSRMRRRGSLHIQELSERGRLQLMNYDAAQRLSAQMKEGEHEENQVIHQEVHR
jgi:hypothetical protein